MSRSTRIGQLMAAVSVLGVSVGMANAADTTDNANAAGVYEKHHTALKLDSTQDKWHSTQIKGESSSIKLDSHMMKYGVQQKGNSVQGKVHAGELNPQPLPPGAH